MVLKKIDKIDKHLASYIDQKKEEKGKKIERGIKLLKSEMKVGYYYQIYRNQKDYKRML